MGINTDREDWYRGNPDYKIRYRDDFQLSHVVAFKGEDIGYTRSYTNALALAEHHYNRQLRDAKKKKCPTCGSEVS